MWGQVTSRLPSSLLEHLHVPQLNFRLRIVIAPHLILSISPSRATSLATVDRSVSCASLNLLGLVLFAWHGASLVRRLVGFTTPCIH